MCTVQPVTLTPAASASSTACQPLNAGSSAGWVFTIRSGYASWIGFSRIVPKPAIATRSTSCACERVDDLVGVRDAVEVLPEARALDDLHRDAGDLARRRSLRTGGRPAPRRPGGRPPRSACRYRARCPTPALRSASRRQRSRAFGAAVGPRGSLNSGPSRAQMTGTPKAAHPVAAVGGRAWTSAN